MDISVSVPATSANLGPGFDTLGVALSLRNEFLIKEAKFTSISLKGEGENISKFKSDNLFVNIFYEQIQKHGGEKRNYRFLFNNKIPVSRGLGSSSAVIVGAITAAFLAIGKVVDKDELLNEALRYEPHPDNITPAVMGGFNVGVIEKKRVVYQKFEVPNDIKAVIVIPPRPISTAHSRTLLPKVYSKGNCVYNISRSSMITAAFASKNWELLRQCTGDKIHQEYRMRTYSELFDVQRVALENGAIMSTLSGSGSTMFQLAYEKDASFLVGKLAESFKDFNIQAVPFDNEGIIYRT